MYEMFNKRWMALFNKKIYQKDFGCIIKPFFKYIFPFAKPGDIS